MTNGQFTVQMHMHTCETSACGRAGGAEMARACKEAGYDMIVITDHFFNANIVCRDKGLSWEEMVECLFAGYRAAKEEGDRIGLTVLKGWETFTKGPEYLTYGLDEEFLLAHPDIADVPKDEYLRLVKEAGGFCIHAHPYRAASYIPPFDPDPYTVEAIEVYNAGNGDPEWNAKALELARKHNLIEVAGSDAHRTDEIKKGAMRFPHALRDTKDLVEALRAREGVCVTEL